MEILTTKNELIEGLKNVKAVETIARDSYSSDINLFKNKRIVEHISLIKEDEDIHIKILNELIEMLENGQS